MGLIHPWVELDWVQWYCDGRVQRRGSFICSKSETEVSSTQSDAACEWTGEYRGIDYTEYHF